MRLFIFSSLMMCVSMVSAQLKKNAYPIPDSLKVSGILNEVIIWDVHPKKESKAGIQADDVYLLMESEQNEREIAMEFPETFTVVTKGMDVEEDKGELEWSYSWQTNETYRLAIFTATDSASNFIMYSGYIYLPKENKWKLIGSVQQKGNWGTIKTAASVQKRFTSLSIQQTPGWFQKNNGRWEAINNSSSGIPIVNLLNHKDSLAQAQLEKKYIQQLIKENKTDAVKEQDGIYYSILKEGTGKQVKVTDTVTVHYKGYLLSDGAVFDQTRERPATFPLNRLIKGWQIGVPLIKTGGKIKIIIPSGLAYSIRTRAAKIPPNSILVFEVEVLEAK